MGMELGSDVPLLRPGRHGAGAGREKQLLSLRALPECWFVVCKPQVSFSTAEMYRRLDDGDGGPPGHPPDDGCLTAPGIWRRSSPQIGNVFEQVLPPGSEIFLPSGTDF